MDNYSSNGFSIKNFTLSNASFDVSSGPSNINSSCIYNINFQPFFLKNSSFHTFIIAAITKSAAPPYIGEFMAALKPC